MAIKIHDNTAWVEASGTFGVGAVITFNPSDLSERQWDVLDSLRDSERLDYVQAIMAGEPTAQWEDAE